MFEDIVPTLCLRYTLSHHFDLGELCPRERVPVKFPNEVFANKHLFSGFQ